MALNGCAPPARRAKPAAHRLSAAQCLHVKTGSTSAPTRVHSLAAYLPHSTPSRLRITCLLHLDNDLRAVLELALVHTEQALRTFIQTEYNLRRDVAKPVDSMAISYAPTVPVASFDASPTRSRHGVVSQSAIDASGCTKAVGSVCTKADTTWSFSSP